MSVPDFCVLCEYTLQVSMNTILTLLHTVFYYMSNWCLQEGCNSLYVCNERPQEKRKSVCATSACKKDVSYTGLEMQEVVQIHHDDSTTTRMYLNRCHLHHHIHHHYRRYNHHHLQPKLPDSPRLTSTPGWRRPRRRRDISPASSWSSNPNPPPELGLMRRRRHSSSEDDDAPPLRRVCLSLTSVYSVSILCRCQ